jgi:CRISPR-associated protein Cas1
VFLRKRQFALTDDEAFCLAVSKRLLHGKLRNMATIVQRIQRTRSGILAGDPAGEIRRMTERLNGAQSLDELRGCEGRAAAAYFPALRFGLKDPMGFEKRVRRPPTDPVNSVLSLLYTFLINRAYAAVRIAGLDPYPGVLHSLDYGRFSLPLDLVEEFRSIIADTLTLSLFNLGVLKRDDFYTHVPPPPEPTDNGEDLVDRAVHDRIGGMTLEPDDDAFDIPEQRVESDYQPDEERPSKPSVRLHPDAFARVVTAFEKKMTTEFYHPLAEQKLTYGEAMNFQARLYRKVVEGEAAEYHPLLLK